MHNNSLQHTKLSIERMDLFTTTRERTMTLYRNNTSPWWPFSTAGVQQHITNASSSAPVICTKETECGPICHIQKESHGDITIDTLAIRPECQ